MPYEIRRKGTRYQVVNTETGEPKGRPTSKAAAEKQLDLLRGIEHGWEPTGEPDTFTRNGHKLHVTGGGKRGTK